MPPPWRCSLLRQVLVSMGSPEMWRFSSSEPSPNRAPSQSGRPRADEWVRALQDLEERLKKCAVNRAHQFGDTLSKCPWCEIEAASGIPLFPVAVVGPARGWFHHCRILGEGKFGAEPWPGRSSPRVNGAAVTPSPTAAELQQAALRAKLAAELPAVIDASRRIQSLKKETEMKAADGRRRWENLQNSWSGYISSRDFQDTLSYLQNLRGQYDSLAQRRLQELQKLEANRHQLQLRAHLDRCRISHARIKGVGAAKKAVLQSYSIETAADIVDHRVLAVPGFGPVLLGNLKRWRDQQERRFVFDPNKGVDQAAKNAVERQILTEKIDLERKLNEGLSKLAVSSSHILTRRRALLAQAQRAARDLAQAQADIRAMGQAARDLAQAEADLRAAEQAARDRAQAEADLRSAEQAAGDQAQAEADLQAIAPVPLTPRPTSNQQTSEQGGPSVERF